MVEDDVDSREALAELLVDHGYVVDTAGDGREAEAMVERDPPALIISDVQMAGGDGLSVVRHLKAGPEHASIPIILVSGLGAPAGEVAGLDLGADDYLAKPLNISVLLARIRAHLRRAVQHRDLDRRSLVDALTGVLNRRGIVAVLQRERERSARSGASLSLALVDVDRFKRINDVHGHAAGDSVLRDVARALVVNARIADDVGRLGGDELVMVLVDTEVAGAARLAARLRSLRVVVTTAVGEELVGLSCGTATLRAGETVDALVARADEAMYADKRGRASRELVAAETASPPGVPAAHSR